MALLKAFTEKARSIGAAPALAVALALSAAPANAENEAARSTAISVADIQPGQRMTEEQARSLSQTAGIVFFCADDSTSQWNCSSAARVTERERPAIWVTGNRDAGAAKVFACGAGGNTDFDVSNSHGTAVVTASARGGYDRLRESGACDTVRLASVDSSPSLDSES